MRLDPVEARVVGSLIEKQLTTPQQYPLTLNGLVSACNQASNRDPVVNFSETDVQSALDSLKQKGLVRFVLPSHGRSVVRYRHVLDERLALDPRQLALAAALLLRGPQTVGELRSRTERMARFETTAEVESDLEGLTRGDDPLVARLARRPGQKEERWTQLMADTGAGAGQEAVPGREDGGAVGVEPAGEARPGPAASGPAASGAAPSGPAPSGAAPSGAAPSGAAPSGAAPLTAPGRDAELGDLRGQLASLRADVEMLRDEVLSLRLELAEALEGR